MMNNNKYKTAIQSKTICLVKYEMKLSNSSEDIAYERVIQTKLYELLKDKDTGLCLEPIGFIYDAYIFMQ